jgi:hypothetical protein
MFPHAVWKNLREEHYGFSTVPTALPAIGNGFFKTEGRKREQQLIDFGLTSHVHIGAVYDRARSAK